MGDGGKASNGFHLNTVAFSTQGVELLVQALDSKFGLKCSVHSRK